MIAARAADAGARTAPDERAHAGGLLARERPQRPRGSIASSITSTRPPRLRRARRNRHPGRAAPDDDDVGLAASRRRGAGLTSRGQLPEPRHAPRERLHQPLEPGHAREELVVIHPVRKEPVGHAEEVHLARAERVLRLHDGPLGGGDHAGHHVGAVVHPREAPVARRAQARRTARSVELGAPGERELAGGDERDRDRLPSLGLDRLAVELEGDRVLGWLQRGTAPL